MYQRTTLDNGLRVLSSEMPHTRSATVSIYVGAGSRYELDSEAGLSHFLEHMLFKGASRRPTAREISEAIEGVGGVHNAGTDREATVYYAKVPATAASLTIDILSDMVTKPVMEAHELEKERHVILEELAGVEDSPGELAGILADEVLWPSQPVGRAIGGTPESVKAQTLDDVNRYFADQYVPSNMVLTVAGNISHEDVVADAQRWLGEIEPRDPGAWHPVAHRNGVSRIGVREKPTEQAHLCLTYPGVANDHPDRFALDLLSTILGEGMSSRLFLELREERALVYDVHSYVGELRDTGAFTIYAGCDPEDARVTLEAALEEVEGVLRDLPDSELNKCKEMADGRVNLRMEDTRAVAGWLGSHELLMDEVPTVEEVSASMRAVTADDIRRVGREWLKPELATLAVVGPFPDTALFEGLIE